MRAVGIMVHGGPEALEVVDVPEVNAGPGQIRVRNHASAVNPTDTMARNGSRAEAQKKDPPPYVPGMDIAGIIDQVGEGVTTGIKVGDRVMAMVCPDGTHGAYREQIVLDQRAVVAAPAGTSHVEACTLPMNALTAQLSLDLMDLKAGQSLAVTGGPGAYGGYIIQLAKTLGLTVIADAAPKDEALLKALGVDIIIPRSNDFAGEVRKHFPNGVDGLADGALLDDASVPAIKDGGVFTAIRGFKPKGDVRGIKFTATWVRTYDCEYEKLDHLRQLVEDGKVTLRVSGTVPPEDASKAHAALEAGGSRGRWVIEF